MTSYIVRTGGQKKKNQLRQKELSLRGDIRRRATRGKLERCAEKVRAAHLGVVKALFHESKPFREEDEGTCNATADKLHESKEYWKSISIDEIIEIYSNEIDDDIYVDRKKW